jgi:KipI family sensor histidine kinase inhibitor
VQGAATPPVPRCSWASDHGLLVSFGDEPTGEVRERVLAAAEALARAAIPGLRNLHPTYTSVLAVCDPRSVAGEAFEAAVRNAIAAAPARDRPERRVVEIPVCYEPEFAADLDDVARMHALTVEELVGLHTSADYVVCFLGFTPGFPYLDGLPPNLATPRLAAPRRSVPAGSVAIGGGQAGIYPFATPGGWRIVGRTPLEIFRVERDPPALLMPGDHVRFKSIASEEFRRLAKGRP